MPPQAPGGYPERMESAHLLFAGLTFFALLLGAGVLHLLPRLGRPGRAVSLWCQRAPGLDLVVTYFTAAPLIVGPIVGGWWGLLAALVAQVAALTVWSWLHELANLRAVKGPRIVKVLNQIVGRPRNHLAVWITALAVPTFWIIRVTEWIVWPWLVLLVRFPRYNQGQWVNVSRQKFDGLVGHDLIWCLYCDWMTGIWSLGTEMLRNVESFWCPIRFDSAKKCENCRQEFPDVDGGWVAAQGNMQQVADVLQQQYANNPGPNAWFGHPSRLTIEGKPIEHAANDNV